MRFSELARMIFQLNALLEEKGDWLTDDLPINSSRWRVLDVLDRAQQPMPAAHIAKDMGLTRQNVTRLTNDLVKEGYLATSDNPYHQRAKLVSITEKGRVIFEEIKRRRDFATDLLLAEYPPEKLEQTIESLQQLQSITEDIFKTRFDELAKNKQRYQSEEVPQHEGES